MIKAFKSKQRVQGQAIFGAFALAIILGVALFYLFNIGTAYSEKVKLADAADAAVYAQAANTAKRLNFAAYTNRAMAINHLAVGHTISYLSWIRYLNDVWTTNPNYFTEFRPADDGSFFGIVIPDCPIEFFVFGFNNCLAHPNPVTFGIIQGINIPFLNFNVGLRAGFLNGDGGGNGIAGAIPFARHEPAVEQQLLDFSQTNPAIFAAQADAFQQAIATNRAITHNIVASYVQGPNQIRVNGCALDDPLCANRNNDVQNTIQLANQLGQNNLAIMLNTLIPIPGLDPAAGNVTANEQSILAFVTSGGGATDAIRNFFTATLNAHPSAQWISNRTWSTPQPPANCINPITDVTGCRFKTGGTRPDIVGVDVNGNDILGDQWIAADNITNFNTGVNASGTASTLLDLPTYTPFPGGFSLPDAQDGNNGPENETLLLQVLLSQQLPFTDWSEGEFQKGRRKLTLSGINGETLGNQTDIFNTDSKILTAYAQAEVFYQRPIANDGTPEWFAAFDQPTREYANLYNPFWQARLVDTVQVNF